MKIIKSRYNHGPAKCALLFWIMFFYFIFTCFQIRYTTFSLVCYNFKWGKLSQWSGVLKLKHWLRQQFSPMLLLSPSSAAVLLFVKYMIIFATGLQGDIQLQWGDITQACFLSSCHGESRYRGSFDDGFLVVTHAPNSRCTYSELIELIQIS